VKERRASVPADAAQLSVLTRFLDDFWSAENLIPSQRTTFELALEEVFMNIVVHGAGPGTRVEVSLAVAADALTMTVEDNGPAFDPLALPAPDVTASLDERPVGGLGVFLVRQTMDAVSYRRVGACNQLCMTKRRVR
jgi:anti-sigma regulatory factor (Ser/Thr protein kinase)